ncbi:acylphosphatase [bacterium]|nr:acylphosphatase [bacterium]
MNVRAHVIFSGKVQGVFFRANTQRKAVELGVKGWVKNLHDRSVEAVFEGDKTQVEMVIDWCSHHQPYAKVKDTKVDWEEYTGKFSNFNIEYF